MNPESISTKRDASKARQEYINNLRLEVSNLQRTQNAKEQVEKMGTAIIPPMDTRTLLEKFTDLEKLKGTIRQRLTEIMDGRNADETIVFLSRFPALLRYTATTIDTYIDYYSQMNRDIGTPAIVFMNSVKVGFDKLSVEERRYFGFEAGENPRQEAGNPPRDGGGGGRCQCAGGE